MSNRHQHLSRGHALFAGSVGSVLQRWKWYLYICFGAAIAGALVAGLLLPEPTRQAAVEAAKAKAAIQFLVFSKQPKIIRSTQNGPERVSAHALAAHPFYQAAWEDALQGVQVGTMAGGGIGVGLCGLWIWWAIRRGREASADNSLRGAAIVSERALRRLTKRRSGHDALAIATVPLPEDLETRHVALIGSTGSGKTTVLRQMLDGIEARGDTAIVYDTSGEFIAQYYRPERGDIILNPFDRRGAFWSPFSEIRHPADADRIAHYIAASAGDADQGIWLEATRNLIADILRKLLAENRGDLTTLIDILQLGPKAELATWLSDTSSVRTFEPGAEKATSSVLFMLPRCSRTLQYLRAEPGDAPSFSFRNHFEKLDRHAGEKPWIFIRRNEQHIDAMRPLLACFLECAATAILGLEPDSRRRVWMILDELADLPKVENLSRLLPQGRKFGAAVVLTFQAIGQMRERYGQDGAEALLANANTKLFLQLGDPATRKWASQVVGNVEVEIKGAAESLDYHPGKGRTSIGSTRQIQPVLIESEFGLPRFEGFLQLPDGYPVARVSLRRDHIQQRGGARHRGDIELDVGQTLWARPRSSPPSADAGLITEGPV